MEVWPLRMVTIIWQCWGYYTETYGTHYYFKRALKSSFYCFSNMVNFCVWFQNQSVNNKFVSSIHFIDEATFGRNCITKDYLHGLVQVSHQQQYHLNPRVGINGYYPIGSYVLPQYFTGQLYLQCLSRSLPVLHEDESLAFEKLYRLYLTLACLFGGI